jgi:hypothetical protein
MELDPTFEAKRLKERSEALKRQRTEMASAAAGQVPSQQYMAASGGAPYFGGYAQAAAAAGGLGLLDYLLILNQLQLLLICLHRILMVDSS